MIDICIPWNDLPEGFVEDLTKVFDKYGQKIDYGLNFGSKVGNRLCFLSNDKYKDICISDTKGTMKVWVVIEFMIDCYYKIWGVYSSREKAEEVKAKLAEYDEKYKPYHNIDGEIFIEEVELDGTDVYEHDVYVIDKEGYIREQWKEFQPEKWPHALFDVYGNLVVVLPVDGNISWKEIYEKALDHWGNHDFIRRLL